MYRQRFYTIKEVSEITGIPTHTIRFWEKDFGRHLKPKRTDGGQRRYSAKDIDIVKKIKHFRYVEKYTIEGTIVKIQR